jgi:hypothetical protein
MKVTPAKKKFGRYNIGDVFEFPDKAARILVRKGIFNDASGNGYRHRMMQAGAATPDPEAPWGRKADGTPRARPGRPPAAPAQVEQETAGDAGATGQDEATE